MLPGPGHCLVHCCSKLCLSRGRENPLCSSRVHCPFLERTLLTFCKSVTPALDRLQVLLVLPMTGSITSFLHTGPVEWVFLHFCSADPQPTSWSYTTPTLVSHPRGGATWRMEPLNEVTKVSCGKQLYSQHHMICILGMGESHKQGQATWHVAKACLSLEAYK